MMYVDYSVTDKCINYNSYGVICVQCNMCGRYGRKTMWQARYDWYVDEIARLTEDFKNENRQTELQQTNIAIEIIYTARKLKECIKHLKWESDKE